MSRFDKTFPTVKPILGMLHLAGEGPAAKLAQAEEEARIMAGEGVDGLVVENYFGEADDVERVLDRLCALPALWVGIFYDSAALAAAWDLCKDWTPEDRAKLRADVTRLGLKAEVAGRYVQHIAQDLVAIAKEGLVTALVGQRPFEMGYKAPSVMLSLIKGEKVDDPVFTGLDECTKDNTDTCIQK